MVIFSYYDCTCGISAFVKDGFVVLLFDDFYSCVRMWRRWCWKWLFIISRWCNTYVNKWIYINNVVVVFVRNTVSVNILLWYLFNKNAQKMISFILHVTGYYQSSLGNYVVCFDFWISLFQRTDNARRIGNVAWAANSGDNMQLWIVNRTMVWLMRNLLVLMVRGMV